MSGVPVGVQMAVLVCSSTGWPPAMTRTAELVYCAVTQGPLPAFGGGIAQPATAYVHEMVTAGWPLSSTRGIGAVGVAWPACEHSTVAPTWSNGPGIRSPS